MSTQHMPPGNIFIVEVTEKRMFSFEKQRDLYRISPSDGEVSLVCPNLAGPSMAAISKDGITLAVVAKDKGRTCLYVLSGPAWEKPAPVAEVVYEVRHGEEVSTEPRLKTTSDGSLIRLTNPARGLTYAFRRAGNWRQEEVRGVQSELNMLIGQVGGQMAGGTVAGPSSANGEVVLVAGYRDPLNSIGLWNRLLSFIRRAPLKDHLAVLERIEGRYQATVVLSVPSGGRLTMRALSERGDTAIASDDDPSGGRIPHHLYLMRRDDPERRWRPHEPTCPEKLRGIVMSADGKVVVTSEAPFDSEQPGYPYDAYAFVWNGRNWSDKKHLSGPFEGETYWGSRIATISPDNSIVASFESSPDRTHYLCCTRIADRPQRLGEIPTASISYDFSPDSGWITYHREEWSEKEDQRQWKRYIARVDGSGNRLIYSSPIFGHHLVGWGV